MTNMTVKTTQLPMNLDTEFLLLDMREPEDYEDFHIREALSYPGTNIKRDKHMPELYAHKNKESKIIVVYHFDEKFGIEYANEFFEKGYDNIYLLNGGIEGFAQNVEGLVEGKRIPIFKKAEETKKFTKRKV